eukprot:163430-Amphidinium_carterae.5
MLMASLTCETSSFQDHADGPQSLVEEEDKEGLLLRLLLPPSPLPPHRHHMAGRTLHMLASSFENHADGPRALVDKARKKIVAAAVIAAA